MKWSRWACVGWVFLGLVGAIPERAEAWQTLGWSGGWHGALQGCPGCPDRAPSLAQRAAWWQQSAPLDSAWVDAGGFLVGPDAIATRGSAVVAGLHAAGLHSAHLTAADLWFGLERTQALIAQADFPVFSANLRSAQGRERLGEAFVVWTHEAQPIVWTGLSAVPNAPVDGVWVEPPAEAWSAVQQEIQALDRAAPVWLCLAGDVAASESLSTLDFSRCAGVVWTGGAEPSPQILQAEGPVHLVLEGNSRTLPWAWIRPGEPPVIERIDLADPKVAGDQEPAPQVDAALQSFPRTTDLWRSPPENGPQEPSHWPAEGQNRGMQVSVLGVDVARQWQGQSAPPGMHYWVLTIDWESRVARDLKRELDYPEAVQVASLRRQVFLQIPGAGYRRPAPIEPDRLLLAGDREWKTTELAFPVAESLRPDDVPAAWLHVTQEPFASIAVPLGSEQAVVEVGEGEALATNEVLAVHAYEIERASEVAPVDDVDEVLWRARVLARSLVTVPTDARALEEGAPLDAQAEIGKPLEYLLAPELVALMDARGMRYAPTTDSPCDPEPVWSAAQPSWVTWHFRLPRDQAPTGLSLSFPGLRFTHETEMRQPQALWLAAKDAPATLSPEGEPLVSWPGNPIAAEVWQGTWQDDHWRVLVRLTNSGPEPGFFLPWKRITWTPAEGRAVECDPERSAGAPASGRLWLAEDGGVAWVECAFWVPAGPTPGTLRFGGVDRAWEVACAVEGDRMVVAQGLTLSESDSNDPSVAAAEPEHPETAPEADRDPPASGELTGNQATPEPRGLAGVGLTAQQVNDAIDRGADYLWAHTREEVLKGDLARFGDANQEHPLIALALAHAGLHERNPEFAAALQDAIPRMESILTKVYANAVLCMLLDHLADPAYQPLLTRAVRHLIEGQGPDGTWSYHVPRWTPSGDGEGTASYVTVLEPVSEGLERETPWAEEPRRGDNSVLQFVLMGLRSGQRRGLSVPAETWERARQTVLERQLEDGAWGYVDSRGYGSMTCAGMASLAIAQWGQGQAFSLQDAPIAAGRRWMAEHYHPSSNPKYSRHQFYYMYSTERVGRLFDTEFYGEHEWYPLGAKYLVQTQAEDGSWTEDKDTVVPTSFALLFLTRATESLLDPVEVPTTARLRIETVPAPESAILFVLDVSGSMRGSLGERNKWQWAREAMLDVFGSLPAEQKVGLRVYGHRLRAIEKGADRDTELLLPIADKGDTGEEAWHAALEPLQPRGKTPMAYSLEQAVSDLRSAREGHIVLLTDGGEDTRERRDPVAAAERIGQRRGWKLHVVGFDIGQPKWREQLQAMAQAGGGAYFAADRGEDLRDRLQGAVWPLPERITLSGPEGDQEVQIPIQLELPPGDYTLRFEVGGKPWEVPARLRAGALTRVRLDPVRYGD